MALSACTLDACVKGNGLYVCGKSSTATAAASSFSRNHSSNVYVLDGCIATLLDGCVCDDSKTGHGWRVHAGGWLMVDETTCSAGGNHQPP